MSTVNKEIADRAIAGEYPEDNIVAILRYENAFNGDYAYKLIFGYGNLNEDMLVNHIINTMWRINTGAPVKIYWCKDWIKKHLINTGIINSEHFL